MAKFSKQMIELQAWQEFELEYLIEPEPELDPNYVGIHYCEDEEIPYSLHDYLDDNDDYISIEDYGYVEWADYWADDYNVD